MYLVICMMLMQCQGVFIKFCIFISELGALRLLFLILNLTMMWVIHLNIAVKIREGVHKWRYSFHTANISKFSDSENTPKNHENMCNYASIFWSWKWRKNMIFVQKISAPKNLEKSTAFLSIFWWVWACKTSELHNYQKIIKKFMCFP